VVAIRDMDISFLREIEGWVRRGRRVPAGLTPVAIVVKLVVASAAAKPLF
jgi:hypothetical protein